MRTVSCCFNTLVVASPATLVTYSINFITFNCLGANFFVPESDRCHKNQFLSSFIVKGWSEEGSFFIQIRISRLFRTILL